MKVTLQIDFRQQCTEKCLVAAQMVKIHSAQLMHLMVCDTAHMQETFWGKVTKLLLTIGQVNFQTSPL